VVDVYVSQQGRGIAVGTHPEREARQQLPVAMEEQLAAILTAGWPTCRGDDDHPDRERVGLRVRTPACLLRAAAIGVTGEVDGREERLQLRDVDVGQQPVLRPGVDRA